MAVPLFASHRSYRTKLEAAFVGMAVLAIALTLWEAEFGAANALRASTLERLTVIRQTRARQIERYFEDVASHVLALAADEATVGALEQFDAALRAQPAFGPAHLARSMTLYGMGRFAEAWSALQKAKEAKADVPPAFVSELATRVKR